MEIEQAGAVTTYRWFSRVRRCGTQTRVPRRKSKKPPQRLLIVRPLGEQIRRLREERGLSQEALAELAGMNYKYLGRIELAQVSAGAAMLIGIAKALGVTVGDLFDTTPV